VELDDDERRFLREIVDGGKGSAERRKRAHLLLLADRGREDGGRTDADIASVLGIGTATVERVRRQCVLDGLEAALERKAQLNRKRRTLDGADWFAGLDLDKTVALYGDRRFSDGEIALVALGWVTPPDVVEAIYTRLRTPRLIRHASTLLARHGLTLTRGSASAAAIVDAFGAIEAFRTGRIPGLVLDAAATCAGKPREPVHALVGELRRIRVNVAPGPKHGDALRAARIDHVEYAREHG